MSAKRPVPRLVGMADGSSPMLITADVEAFVCGEGARRYDGFAVVAGVVKARGNVDPKDVREDLDAATLLRALVDGAFSKQAKPGSVALPGAAL
jgi:hypothetical protein